MGSSSGRTESYAGVCVIDNRSTTSNEQPDTAPRPPSCADVARMEQKFVCVRSFEESRVQSNTPWRSVGWTAKEKDPRSKIQNLSNLHDEKPRLANSRLDRLLWSTRFIEFTGLVHSRMTSSHMPRNLESSMKQRP